MEPAVPDPAVIGAQLSKLQRATLVYIYTKMEVTRYTQGTGTRPMKRLVALGLLRVSDTSYPGSGPQKTWSLTPLGDAVVKATGDFGATWMSAAGWEDG